MYFVKPLIVSVIAVTLISFVAVTALRLGNCDTKNVSVLKTIPAFYDNNGVLLMDVMIDEQWVKAVVDTGSTYLLVGGPKCKQCDTLQGGIVPKTEAIETNYLIRYGSQEDMVNWHKGDIKLGKNGPWFKKINFAVATERTGSSSYNVLGLGRIYKQDTHHENTFLSQCGKGEGIITIDMNKKMGSVLLGGKSSQHPPVSATVQMLPEPHFRVPLHSIGIETYKTIDESMLPVGGLIFDTGSNMMDIPSALFDILLPGFERNLNFFLTFVTVTGKSVTVTFTSDRYRWETGELLIERGSDPEYIVIGSLFMRNLRLRFDLKANTVGIGTVQ